MESTSVSRNLSLLEKQGLIQRGDKKLARKLPVSLTPKGQGKLREAHAGWEKAQSSLESKLESEELANTIHALRLLRQLR